MTRGVITAGRMVTGGQLGHRYRAKPARRPLLFWWQAFALLGIVVLLWWQLPVAAVLFEARAFPPLPAPHAAYAVLDPAYAAQVFKGIQSSWARGGQADRPSFELDLGFVDLADRLAAPSFLEQGARYPVQWQPSPAERLAYRLPPVEMAAAEVRPVVSVARQPFGVKVFADVRLSEASFKASVQAEDLGGHPAGHVRLYVETGGDGGVEHVLILQPQGGAGYASLVRAMKRGRATGAARGVVDVFWDTGGK